MSWRVIAEKELRTLLGPRRSKALLGLVFVVFTFGGYLLPVENPAPTTADYAVYMKTSASLLVPLVGLLLGYKAVVDERASGRLTLLLSLPHGRRDTVLGKYLARVAVLAGTLTVGIGLGVALVDYPFGSFEAGDSFAYLGLSLLHGATFLGIGVAISTATASNRAATAAAFGVFFLFVVVWAQLRGALVLLFDYLGLAEGGLPDWALFLYGAEPGMLYSRVVDAQFAGVTEGAYLGSEAPWFLGAGPATVLLVGWVLLPPTVGYLQFRRTDL